MGGVKLYDGDRHYAGIGAGASMGLHTVAKPQPHTLLASTLGHYRLAGVTGAIAAGAAADAQVFSFRWTDTTRYAVITSIKITGMRATTAFVAGNIIIEALMARSFSAAASGGTAMTLTTNNGKMRSDMGTTLLANAMIATTGALTAGTQTLDAQPFGQIVTNAGSPSAATPVIGSIYLPGDGFIFKADVANGEHPIVLTANEGFVVRATVPATGVWNLGVQVAWAEVHSF